MGCGVVGRQSYVIAGGLCCRGAAILRRTGTVINANNLNLHAHSRCGNSRRGIVSRGDGHACVEVLRCVGKEMQLSLYLINCLKNLRVRSCMRGSGAMHRQRDMVVYDELSYLNNERGQGGNVPPWPRRHPGNLNVASRTQSPSAE